MATNPAIAAAIAAAAAAKAATEAAAPAAQTQVAVQNPNSTAVNTYQAPAPKLSMETVSTGNMSVDNWIKPKEFGLILGDSKKLFTAPMTCTIDMTDGRGFIVKKGIKAGNPAEYKYTVDGVTCTTGGSWEAAIAKMKGISNTAYEYRCVDLPFTVLEDVVVDGSVEAKAGTTLGNTTSTTNWANWEKFYKAVVDADLLGQVVVVKVGHEARTNKANNNWGVLTFELVDSLENYSAGSEG